MVERGIASVDCQARRPRRLQRAPRRGAQPHDLGAPGDDDLLPQNKGRIVVPMPWTNVEYWHMTHTPDLEDFELDIWVDPVPTEA